MVNVYVVDACVGIKWYVPEIHKDAALRLHNPAYQLHVPAFFLLEIGINVKSCDAGKSAWK